MQAHVCAYAYTACNQPDGMHSCCADEAAAAASAARSLGLAAHVDALDWRGRPPATGKAEEARGRRYEALHERCRQLGVSILLVAHNSGARLLRARPGGTAVPSS